jgi:ribonuclease Z
MSERKLIVMGTASQVPARERNQNGYFLRFDDEGFLFDPGEGTQRQMIFAGVSVSGITRIFISHFHGDHCLGLAGIIQRISLDRVPHPVEVYYPASGQRYYEHLRDACSYHHAAHLVERPISEDGRLFENERLFIEARSLDHDIETYGYRIQEKDSFTLLPHRLVEEGIAGEAAGLLKKEGRLELEGRIVLLQDMGVRLPGQAFAYVMDTRLCPAVFDLASGADLLLMEATFLSDLEDKAREFGHLTAAQAGMAARDSGVDLLVITHYSQRYLTPEALVQEASQYHPRVRAALDGDHIELPRRRRTGQKGPAPS